MQTDKRPSDGSGRDDGRRRRPGGGHGRGDVAPDGAAGSRDAYEDEQDEAIDADPQLREIGRARLRKRAGRPAGGDESGGPRR